MYGMIQTLLERQYNMQDKVLIESPFEEGTRFGASLNSQGVILAITPNKFIIASEKNAEPRWKRAEGEEQNIENFALVIYPLNSVRLTVFKKTQRQSLKVVFNGMVTRYFELGRMPRRKIFWKLWCRCINELKKGRTIWPYLTDKPSLPRLQINRQRWTDKYLFLGSKRHAEDEIRPIPIPGIGQTEDKLFYLKPQYFGCWDQAEHWVQCNEEKQATTKDYEELTYTDDPNSNITYTSLMTTVGIIGQF